jgi:hypothetical protein
MHSLARNKPMVASSRARKGYFAIVALVLMVGAIDGDLYLSSDQDEEHNSGGYKCAPLLAWAPKNTRLLPKKAVFVPTNPR